MPMEMPVEELARLGHDAYDRVVKPTVRPDQGYAAVDLGQVGEIGYDGFPFGDPPWPRR